MSNKSTLLNKHFVKNWHRIEGRNYYRCTECGYMAYVPTGDAREDDVVVVFHGDKNASHVIVETAPVSKGSEVALLQRISELESALSELHCAHRKAMSWFGRVPNESSKLETGHYHSAHSDAVRASEVAYDVLNKERGNE